MIVVDASCLIEVLTGAVGAGAVLERLAREPEQSAPHIVDVEVFGVLRRQHLRGDLDATAAHRAISDMAAWAGERFSHRPLLARAWELNRTVSGFDAMYVALAEALSVPLLTRDQRLASATGPRCRIETIS